MDYEKERRARALAMLGEGIGAETAARAHVFGMRVIALRRRANEPVPGIDAIYGRERLQQFLKGGLK